jgi:hypothetical protein
MSTMVNSFYGVKIKLGRKVFVHAPHDNAWGKTIPKADSSSDFTPQKDDRIFI